MDKIYLAPPFQTKYEAQYFSKALASNWLAPNGPFSSQLSKTLTRLSGAKYVSLTNSGTSAIHLALQLLNIGKGDEVICPTYTFAASLFPVLYQQATPILVDCDSTTWNIDLSLLKTCILDRIKKGKKPKAIIAVHTYGNPIEWKKLTKIASKFKIPIIEDAAESVGSTYKNKPTGGLGDFGIYSFNANKIVTGSGGGCLLTDQKKKAKTAALISQQAKDPERVFYHHTQTGYNYAMSNIQAAMIAAQLETLEKRVSKKKAIFSTYQKKVTSVSFQKECNDGFSNRWLTAVQFKKEGTAHKLNTFMNERQIETRLSWKPMHMQPIFKPYPSYLNGNAEKLFNSVLCLPSGVGLSKKEQKHVIESLKIGMDDG
ncbi:MAG: DegT/DnrJ/EryC1/StrS family aminotransferase [Cyclobacteriaceae bacterium]